MFIRSKRFISSLLCLALVFSLLGTFGLGSVQAEAGIEGYTPAMTVSELKASGADAAAGSAYSISSMDELYDLAEYINWHRMQPEDSYTNWNPSMIVYE